MYTNQGRSWDGNWKGTGERAMTKRCLPHRSNDEEDVYVPFINIMVRSRLWLRKPFVAHGPLDNSLWGAMCEARLFNGFPHVMKGTF
eukprot:255464-Heterocapsa_arctica.AAC.1